MIILTMTFAWSKDDSKKGAETSINASLGHEVTIKEEFNQISIPTGITFEDGLTEEECITLALVNNADFQVALTQLGLDNADLIQSGQWTNPIFSLIFPYGPRQWEIVASLPIQEIWLNPRRKATALMRSEATVRSIVNSGLDLVRDVRLALIGIQFAQRSIQSAQAQMASQETLARHLSERYRLGLENYQSIVQANTQLLELKIALAAVESDYQQRQFSLENLLGLSEYKSQIVFEPLERTIPNLLSVTRYKTIAIGARPDYRAAELSLEAAAKERGITQTEFYAILGKLDVDFPNGNGKAAPGLEFALPVFNQGRASRKRAQAEWQWQAAQFASVRHKIFAEVENAFENLQASNSQIQIVDEELIPSLEAELARIESIVDENLLDASFAIRAERELIGGQSQFDRVHAQQLISLIELERATGGPASL